MYLGMLCALFLVLSIASFWFFEKRVYGFALYLIALGLALTAQRISPIGLITLAVFFIGFVLVNNPAMPKKVRPIGYLLLIGIGVALSLHISPGFSGWEFISACRVSPTSKPFSLCLNFDKVSLGIFILASGIAVCHSSHEWKKAIHVGLVFSVLAVVTLFLSAWLLKYVRWDPKLPIFTPMWIIANLFFTCVIEEVIVRGFIQNKLMKMSSSFRWNSLFSLAVSSAVFGLGHYKMGTSMIILAFIAGLFYGGAYIASNKKVEASILTHFSVNFIHLIGFSYPALGLS